MTETVNTSEFDTNLAANAAENVNADMAPADGEGTAEAGAAIAVGGALLAALSGGTGSSGTGVESSGVNFSLRNEGDLGEALSPSTDPADDEGRADGPISAETTAETELNATVDQDVSTDEPEPMEQTPAEDDTEAVPASEQDETVDTDAPPSTDADGAVGGGDETAADMDVLDLLGLVEPTLLQTPLDLGDDLISSLLDPEFLMSTPDGTPSEPQEMPTDEAGLDGADGADMDPRPLDSTQSNNPGNDGNPLGGVFDPQPTDEADVDTDTTMAADQPVGDTMPAPEDEVSEGTPDAVPSNDVPVAGDDMSAGDQQEQEPLAPREKEFTGNPLAGVFDPQPAPADQDSTQDTAPDAPTATEDMPAPTETTPTLDGNNESASFDTFGTPVFVGGQSDMEDPQMFSDFDTSGFPNEFGGGDAEFYG